jgi:hypothetical protein
VGDAVILELRLAGLAGVWQASQRRALFTTEVQIRIVVTTVSSRFISNGCLVTEEPIWDLGKCCRGCIRSRGGVGILRIAVIVCLNLLSIQHLLALHLLVEDHLHHILDLLNISM